MKIETWKDVSDFLKNCTEEQLQAKAFVQTEEEAGGYISFAQNLEEDNYSSDEGMIPVSTISEEELEDEPLSERSLIPKGSIYISFDL